MKDYYKETRQQRIKDYQDYSNETIATILESRPIPEKLKVQIWIS